MFSTQMATSSLVANGQAPANSVRPLELFPGVHRGELPSISQRVLSTGSAAVDSALPDSGLPKGAVTELAVYGGAALGTSLSLGVCRTAMEAAIAQGGEVPWCAFVDPGKTLYAPGVESRGVDLARLLVVRPPSEALERTSIRLVESHAFAVVVVDTLGTVGASASGLQGSWNRAIRRLSLAAEASGSVVVLLTDGELQRSLPLPVALRLELSRPEMGRLLLKVGKDRKGRVSGPHRVPWGASLGNPLSGHPGPVRLAHVS